MHRLPSVNMAYYLFILFIEMSHTMVANQGQSAPPENFHREISGDKLGKMRQGKTEKIENVEENEEKWNREGGK